MPTANTIGQFLQQHNSRRPLTYNEPSELSHNYAVGIELELEGVREPPDINRAFWTTEHDGSLRNGGIEIMCNGPLSGNILEKGLEDLENSLMNLDYRTSERCSTHIHIDATDMSAKQLTNFLTLSCIFENSLFTLFGAERRANTFCLSFDRGSSNLENICKVGSDPSVKKYMNARWSKYAGISLNRLRDLGTVEFRMFSPLVKKADYMKVLRFLFSLKAEAMAMEDIQEIITYKKAHSLSDLFTRIFPEEAYTADYEKDLEGGIQLANDIINSIELEAMIKAKTSDMIQEIKEMQRTVISYSGGV